MNDLQPKRKCLSSFGAEPPPDSCLRQTLASTNFSFSVTKKESLQHNLDGFGFNQRNWKKTCLHEMSSNIQVSRMFQTLVDGLQPLRCILRRQNKECSSTWRRRHYYFLATSLLCPLIIEVNSMRKKSIVSIIFSKLCEIQLNFKGAMKITIYKLLLDRDNRALPLSRSKRLRFCNKIITEQDKHFMLFLN